MKIVLLLTVFSGLALTVSAKLTPLEIDQIACKPLYLKNQDRYICDDQGNVTCLTGWTNAEGEDEFHKCSQPVCSPVCENGDCIAPNTCACKVGWEGNDCNTCITLPGCVHGACDNEGLGCTCTNPSAYAGGLCDIPVCTTACENGGVCVAPDQCRCPSGFSGTTCGICETLPGCVTGLCSENQAGDEVPNTCKCETDQSGLLCDELLCSPSCVNGVCKDFDGDNKCICEPGWEGDNCGQCTKYPGCDNGECELPNECTCSSSTIWPCGVHDL